MSVGFFFGVGGVVYSGVSVYRIVGGAMDGFMGLYIVWRGVWLLRRGRG